ncbi:MAG: tetratricopeptide repeat protein [Lysobacterales bacterium]
MSDTSFFSELWRRRVPQILGFYVAATWMAVEIGDWMIERFSLPSDLTSYVFIGMVVLLPAVGVFAWGHGAPGKDRWTRFQAAFVSVNLAAAVAAIVFWTQQPASTPSTLAGGEVNTAATQTIEVVGDDGAVETHEVAKDGYHQSLFAFFWKNTTGDETLDWLSYGGPWALAEDLRRSPLISIQTPLNVSNIVSQFKDKGFDSGVGEPLSLDLQLARDRGLSKILTGEFGFLADGALEITARLIEVETGVTLSEWRRSGSDWLDSADDLSGDIRQWLLKDVNTNTIITELSIKEHTSSNPEAIKDIVEAQRLRSFDNNYVDGLTYLNSAVEKDPTFAEAHVLAHLFLRNLGDFQGALESAQQALQLDYKLYSERKFMLKANIQAVQGRTEQAMWMLERWAEIHPQSAEAHSLLGNNYLTLRELDKAKVAFERLLELEPGQRRTLLSIASILRLEGKVDEAIALINDYIADQPESAEAHMDLANTYIQAGKFEQAREAFEEAAFLDDNNARAEIALATLLLREGAYDQALNALNRLEQQGLPDRQAFSVQQAKQYVFSETGQMSKALESLETQKKVSASFLQPILQIFQIGIQQVALHASKGDGALALEKAEEIKEQLKPPFDGYATFAMLEIHDAMKNHEIYLQELEKLETFVQAYPNPAMKPFLDPYRARGLSASGKHQEAADMLQGVMVELKKSVAILDAPYVIEAQEMLRVKFLRKAGQLDEGLEAITELLKVNPGFNLARLERVKLLLEKDHIDLAKNEFDQLAIRWRNADPGYLSLIGYDDIKQQLASNG